MKTSKPISTISFNSKAYLRLKLDELLKAKKISKYYFIEHKPEDDEGGAKFHCHVYVEPSKMIQTDDLREFLKEFDPSKPDKPLGCLVWRSSKFGQWYLYALHDKSYLASKGESRRYHYLDTDFCVSDQDDFNYDIRTVDVIGELGQFKQIESAIERGQTFEEFLCSGRVPIPQIMQFEKVWHLLASMHTSRGSHEPHPNSVDESTGEVLDDRTENI